MISAQTLTIIKATVPVLAEHGEHITRLFYQKLFIAHPALKDVFNLANQAKGEQARALATAVFQYASHIDKLDALGDAVNRIAHKHASLQVTPEQYPIVGKYLLAAIAEHLSLADDDPIILAWAEAYGVLAKIFVAAEQQIYQDNAAKPGGWQGDRAFVISQIVNECPAVKSFWLTPADGQAIASFAPGQYVGLKVQANTSEHTEIRQYSLSDAPGQNHYRITVKAEALNTDHQGIVSHDLHASKVGDQVLLQPPTGDFIIKQDHNNLVLLAGGVGITPLLSMLLAAIASGQDLSQLIFIQCCRDADHQIMASQLRTLSHQHGFKYYVSYEVGTQGDFEGYLTTEILQQWLGETPRHAYFCGPKVFMSAVNQHLQAIGYQPEQLHYETFGPSIMLN